jgi:hypothetical protein
MTTHYMAFFLGGAGGSLISAGLPLFGRTFSFALVMAGICLTAAGMVS